MIRRQFRRFVSWCSSYWIEFFTGTTILLLLLFVLWSLIVHNVPPGHVGVLWLRFFGGTVMSVKDAEGRIVKSSRRSEGLQLTFPWDKIYVYDARLQRLNEAVRGLSIDGLDVEVDVTARYVINADAVAELHKALGPNYDETLLRPQLRSIILTHISRSEAHDLYSIDRQKLQKEIELEFNSALSDVATNVGFDANYAKLENVLIEEIKLPPFVRQAIQEKERVRHMNEAYEFRLALESKERQRKQIEAEGIRVFQEIVSPGITESYLRWRGIEATLQLSASNNAKVVIIGSGKDGLPIILNTQGQPLSPQLQQSVPAPGETGPAAPDKTGAAAPAGTKPAGGTASPSPSTAVAGAKPPMPGGLPGTTGMVPPMPQPGGPEAFLPARPEQGPLTGGKAWPLHPNAAQGQAGGGTAAGTADPSRFSLKNLYKSVIPAHESDSAPKPRQ